MAAPLDFGGAAGRAVARIQPAALVIMETELWPNLICAAEESGAVVVLAAGRLTERSFRRYSLVRGFMASLLSRFDLIGVSGQAEKDMFAALGAPPERLALFGNPKFDGLLESYGGQDFRRRTDEWAWKLWGEGPHGPVIVAGSTHPGEEEAALDAFMKAAAFRPELRLILAPRHLTRVEEVQGLVKKHGLAPVLSSAAADQPLLRRAKAAIVDSMGALPHLYALATMAIVGGSLREGLMGHNPLEPAAAGTPLMFGPHMKSFAAEAAALLAVGGAAETSAGTLARDIEAWLRAPDQARAAAEAARRHLAERAPAAPALAAAVLGLMFNRPLR
jgi:3-deoxy-D-manno-octulosonic-acid transferase